MVVEKRIARLARAVKRVALRYVHALVFGLLCGCVNWACMELLSPEKVIDLPFVYGGLMAAIGFDCGRTHGID